IRDRADWFMASPMARHFSDWGALARESSDLAIVERFDREWRSFSRVGAIEQGAIFDRYFDVVPKELLAEGRLVLDAGCGAGRWATAVSVLRARRSLGLLPWLVPGCGYGPEPFFCPPPVHPRRAFDRDCHPRLLSFCATCQGPSYGRPRPLGRFASAEFLRQS